jgi:hypothetical protein
MQRSTAWLSWLKLVEVFATVCKPTMDIEDIERIDDLCLQHSRLFDKVPQYNGLKRPKHHLLQHVPGDVWRFGPPKGYWCFGFEAFNKVIKSGARASNFKDVTTSIMRYWQYRSARYLRDGHDSSRRF